MQGWEKLPIWLALVLVDVARSTLLGDKPDEESERDLYRVDVLLLRCLESKNFFILQDTRFVLLQFGKNRATKLAVNIF